MNKNKACGECKYFCQHYINKDTRGYHPIGGHCLKRRIKKDILPDCPACQNFEELDRKQQHIDKQKTSRLMVEKIEEKLTKLLEFIECN